MSETTSPRARILIVEDDATLRAIFEVTLRQGGYETAVAGDGIEALAQLETFKPDFIALDLMMPRMDGARFLGRLKELGVRIPVVVVTAFWEEVNENLLRQDPNVVDIMHKPVRYSKVVELIRKVLHQDAPDRSGPAA